MIKLSGKTIADPLKLIFRSMLEEGVFHYDWKKSNVVPIHKRDSKNLIKNIDLSALFLFSAKFLKDLHACKTTYSLNVSLASFMAIHVLLNSCQLRKKSTKILIVICKTI